MEISTFPLATFESVFLTFSRFCERFEGFGEWSGSMVDEKLFGGSEICISVRGSCVCVSCVCAKSVCCKSFLPFSNCYILAGVVMSLVDYAEDVFSTCAPTAKFEIVGRDVKAVFFFCLYVSCVSLFYFADQNFFRLMWFV